MNTDINVMKRKLLVKYPFFGSIVANTNFEEEQSIPTAGTDGETIYYNKDLVNKLNDDEKIFLFAHEVCHIAFNHILRSEGKDQRTWNIATDSVINALLKQDGLPLIKGVVDIKEAINHDAEEMYNKLLEEQKEKQDNQNQSGNSNSEDNKENNGQTSSNENNPKNNNQNNKENENNQSQNNNNEQENQNEEQNETKEDVGHDTHSLWEKAVERKKQQESKSKETEEQKTNKEEQIEKSTELGEKYTFKQNKLERKKQLEELRKALARESHSAGTTTNSEERKVDNIGVSQPLIDWRKILKEAVKVDVDWSYKNASIEDGVITPYLEEMPYPETEILLDTSGSINIILLRNFLRECKNILKTSKIKVGCFDTEFYGFTDIKTENDIEKMKFVGGGGTDFNVAVNAFSKRVENKIIFTDGWADMPDQSIDAIWLVFGGEKIKPKGGKVIHITDEQLRKLSRCKIEDNPYNNPYIGKQR